MIDLWIVFNRGDTNKKQITNFIVETIREYLPQRYGDDKHQLFAQVALWEFVGLLVKQNGVSHFNCI